MTQVFKGNNGHYTYASSSDVDLYLENLTSSINVKNTDRIDYIVDIVRGKLEVLYLALCKQLENEGYADLEERDSDVCISNMIIANEFEFTKDGERTRF